jgi:dipeptidyl aminopeptidase/acylaminoacyl peptidase
MAAVATAVILSAPAKAAPPPIEAYGRLPAIENIGLSPSGKYMVSFGDVDGKRYILIRTVDGAVRLSVPADKVKVRRITWVDDDHVLVTASATNSLHWNYEDKGEYWFTFNINIAQGKASVLFDKDERFAPFGYGLVAGYVIDGKPYAFAWNRPREGTTIGSRVQNQLTGTYTRYYPDLWRIDLNTNEIVRVVGGTERISSWIVGPEGQVAGYTNYDAIHTTWALFHGEQMLLKRQSPTQKTWLMGLGRIPGSILVFDQSTGVDQWIEVTADGATQILWKGENVTTPLISEVTGLLIGANIDDSRFEFFDPAKQAKINAAIKPFHGNLWVHSATDAVDKVVVHTDGLGDSGTYYLVDLSAHSASIIDNDYPDVPGDQVGEERRITYKAADGLGLDGVLTLPPGRPAKNLPVIVLPHGGPIGEYNDVRFNWLAQAFASRGYAVFQPNYRGSGNRGAAFELAGNGEYGRGMLTDMSDGLKSLVAQGIVDPKRACIVGFDYGGYAALAGVTVQQGLYRCAVAGSGLSDLTRMYHWEEERLGYVGTASLREMFGIGLAGAPSLDSISPVKFASRADAPILLIHGTDDSVVPIVQSQAMNDALKAAGKPVEFVITKDEDHWLSNSATRVETLKAAIAFVQKYNPAD